MITEGLLLSTEYLTLTLAKLPSLVQGGLARDLVLHVNIRTVLQKDAPFPHGATDKPGM